MLTVCRRLGDSWNYVADYLEIGAQDRDGFRRGRQANDLWKWLALRDRLGELSPALRAVGRADLADILDRNDADDLSSG